MSDRISIIRWRDPKTDPPEIADETLVLAMLGADLQVVTASRVQLWPQDYGAWAELPAPSDATLDDLAFLIAQAQDIVDGGSGAMRGIEQAADRLRALLPGGEHD